MVSGESSRGAPPSPATTLAVILGASEWPRWGRTAGGLGGGKQFLNSANALREYLHDPRGFNLPPENLLWLFDSEANPDDLDYRLSEFLRGRTASPARGGTAVTDLLIYYVGHGGFEGGDSDYYLMIRNSRPENRSTSSLRMVSLARTIKESARHLRCYLILDCCFSARGVEPLMSPVADLAAARTKTAFEDYANSGTALLCSSAKDKASQAPSRKEFTMFTGALLKALREGSAGEPERLSLQSLGDMTWDIIRQEYKERAVRPEVHSPRMPSGDVARLPLFPNLAATHGLAPDPEPAALFEPAEGATQTYIVVSEVEAAGGRAGALKSVVRSALRKYGRRIQGVTKQALRENPHVVTVAEVFASEAQYENAVLAMCRAEVVVFDVTNYEPAVMLLMGIRSVVRRGVTLASAGGDHIMGEAMDFPFNIKEVNIVAHSAQQVATREPIDIFGQRILEGVEQLATLSNYLDLPAFDAVRNLPLDPKRRRARGYKEAVLVLCSFSEKYQANNWRRHLRRFLTVYIPRDEDRDRDPEVLRTLDMKSPRLVSQSLYEAIRQLEMCVVDWTEWRPNVFFELGVRLATNRIGPVCVIDDAWRRRPEVPRAGARARRARGGAKGQPGDEELRLAGAAGQCARLFELFDPIVYRCPEGDVEGDAEAFERMTSRHEHYVGGGGAESTSALAPAFTYEVITRHIDWRVEAATKPVHRELADAANMISSPDVDSQGESTILYPRNPELAEKTEVGALERRLAAWYYLDNRHGWDKILNDADLSAHYEALGERLITQLLRSPSEENQELGDRIDERMGEYRKFKKAKE